MSEIQEAIKTLENMKLNRTIYNFEDDAIDLILAAFRKNQERESLPERWENIHMYEYGENIRTIGSNCEVLIKGADLLALIFPDPHKLTRDELRLMDRQPVYIKYLCESDEEDGWDIINNIESRARESLEDFGDFVSFACGDGDYLSHYGKTWIAYDRRPGR